ncbi:MAG: fold metallo-hydrolase [Caulobacter sp.]|nr:fold metallo-hydrolase [Caulobacter sp.]
MQPDLSAYFHPATGTVTYLLVDPATQLCAIIDPVLDYDPETGATATDSVDLIIAEIRRRDLGPTWILETGLHTGHLSAAGHLKYETGASICIGAGVTASLKRFAPGLGATEVDQDGWDFDKLAKDRESLPMGGLKIVAVPLAGRLPGSMAYRVGDRVFIGDALLMPDRGAGRCDLPLTNAGALYDTLRGLFTLPPATRLYTGLDRVHRREPAWESTVAEQKAGNIQLRDGVSRERFMAMRAAADAAQPPPAERAAALQVAIRAGRLPAAGPNGERFKRVDIRSL